MDASFTVQGEQLREAATDLRDNMGHYLLMAREKIADDPSFGDFGPTLAPAAQAFLDAWRAELAAVASACEELAKSFEAAAFAYDLSDQQSSDGLQCTL
jgi:Excreted virulence factor EspC, type VII ESX diderm